MTLLKKTIVGLPDLTPVSLRYFRFMHTLDLSTEMLVRFTQIDYSREIAVIAATTEQGADVEAWVTRFAINPDGESCEFALVIADTMGGKGLGQRLMTALMDAARSKELKVMTGEILSDNDRMLKLVSRPGSPSKTARKTVASSW